MADYSGTMRTNYFRVKDENAFRELMERVYPSVHVFEKLDTRGRKLFGFGAYEAIAGVTCAAIDEDPDAQESAYDEFIRCLQECIADDDAIIMIEAGHEKLNYVAGKAEIITATDYRYVDITRVAVGIATEMLANPNWETCCEY